MSEQFWQLTLQLWADSELERAALWLQDQHGLDPNLLLLLIWQQRHGRHLNSNQLGHLADAIAPWIDDVVKPYRSVRQRAKAQLGSGDYERMKQVELSLERQTQALLLTALAQCPLSTQTEQDNLTTCLAYLELAPEQLPDGHYQALQAHLEPN